MVRARRSLSGFLFLGLASASLTLMPPLAHAAPNDTTQHPQKIKASIKGASAVLALDATVKNSASTGKTVRTQTIGDQTFLSLQDITALLDFAITVRPAQADGFFIAPKNQFTLNLDEGRVEVRGVKSAVSKQEAQSLNGELYVSTLALLSWFDIGTMIDHEKNNIHFSTPNLLPREAQATRQRKHQTLTASTPAGLVRDISGGTVAGYEVELYQEKKLLAFQFADASGAYRFKAVPVTEGDNSFRIVSYGPQGQIEEKTETVSVSSAQPPAPMKTEAPQYKPPAPSPMAVSAANQQPVILPKNWKELSLVQDDEQLGTIEAYIGARGVFLRFDAFLRALHVSHTQQISADVIEIVVQDDHHIVLDMAKRTYVDQGQHYKLYDNDAFKNDDKIYANEALLHRLFDHTPFVVDQALGKVRLPAPAKKTEPLPTPQPTTAEKADIAPPPVPAPVVPVIIDDLVSAGRAPTPEKETTPDSFEAHDVLHIEQAPSSNKGGDHSDGVADDKSGEPLILQPRLKTLPPSAAFIEALDLPGQVFLPLNDLFQIFEFPIKIEQNKASGYFFTPENDFTLDVDHKEAHLSGKRIEVTRSDLRRHGGQIYISSDALLAWFGIASEVDRNKGTIHFTTDRLLPREEQEARQKKWGQLLRATEVTDKDYPILQNAYQLAGPPTIDVNLSSSYDHANNNGAGASTSLTNAYNVQGAAELGYLTSQFYAQGSSTGNTLDTLRIQAGRKDPKARLLGGMGATEFALGDITSPSLSFVTANAMGRGAMVTNRDVMSSENFDVRSFSGDSVPGYEVELYRNNVLLSFQTVDGSGRYTFKDIPILYGENTFRLVFYGPQGQREERVESVSAASALLKENKFEYTIGAVQRGLTLIPVGIRPVVNANVPDGNQFMGGFRYGVTSNYTVGAAVAETLLGDGPHRYVTTSSGANLFGVLSETSFAKDVTSGGWASGMSILGGFEDISLRARYRSFNNFMSESVNSSESPRTSEASLDANTQLYLPLLQEFALGLGAVRETFIDGTLVPRTTYGFRLSKSLWGLSFTNTLDYIRDSDQRVHDTFGVQTRLWDINFRTTGLYELKPAQQFRTASVMADYRLTDRLSAQTALERDLSNKRTAVNQNVNWDFDAFRLGANNMMDSHGDYAVSMNVLFSLNHDSTANRWRMQPQQSSSGGAITGRVFVDENSNGKFDAGEKLVTEGSVRVNRAAVKLDENGYFVTPVSPYETSKVELSATGLSDPLLTPTTKGYQVITRPGDTVVADFPLVHTTIIDGTTFMMSEQGDKREIGNIVVELQDKEGKPIRRVISEVDGYFSIDKIPVGDYWLSVPDEVLSSVNASVQKRVQISIAEVKEFVTGKDIMLVQKEKLNGPPVFETPLPALPAAPMTPLPTPPTLPETLRVEKTAKSEEGPDEPPASKTNDTDKNSEEVTVVQ